MSGPFYYAWVTPLDTTFSPTFERYDEAILSLLIDHVEGDIPTATIEIRNPHVGLINPGRNIWAWISWRDAGGTVHPIFFGRLVGEPTDVDEDTDVFTIVLIAKPLNYNDQKQALANAMSVLPYWDPVFIDYLKRNDPDTILNGYTKLWHTDRVTHVVSASDILIGEDALETFNPSDVPRDNVKRHLGQTPLSLIMVEATVNWTQTAAGHISLGQKTTTTYVGEALIGGWPKPYTALGGGWTTGYTYALDKSGTGFVQMLNLHQDFQNRQHTHSPGDVMELHSTLSAPSFDGTLSNAFLKYTLNVAYTTAFLSPDPTQQDQPTATSKTTYLYVAPWTVETAMAVSYQAIRQRTERIRFRVEADVQPIVTQLASPGAIPGDTPDFETISIQGADVGAPILIVTQQQIQNSVVTGIPLPSPTASEMAYSTTYGINQMVSSAPYDNGTISFPQSYFLTGAGAKTGTGLDALGRPPIITLPNGQPVPGPIPPPIAVKTGPFTDISYLAPINSSLAHYFPTPRGYQSVEYLLMLARARLMMRARCVEIEFDCRWERAINLSCRKNALLIDPHLPGGIAEGKIIGYSLRMDGDVMIGHVKMGCAIGLGNSVGAIAGTPVYVEDAYVEYDYQQHLGAQKLTDAGNIWFEPPLAGITDDGLIFPLTKDTAVIANSLDGNAGEQAVAIAAAAAKMQTSLAIPRLNQTPQQQLSLQIQAAKEMQQIGFQQDLKRVSQYILALRAVEGGPFGAEYDIAVGNLSIPLMIDLGAPSA